MAGEMVYALELVMLGLDMLGSMGQDNVTDIDKL